MAVLGASVTTAALEVRADDGVDSARAKFYKALKANPKMSAEDRAALEKSVLEPARRDAKASAFDSQKSLRAKKSEGRASPNLKLKLKKEAKSEPELQLDGSKVPSQLEFKKETLPSPSPAAKDEEGVDEITFESRDKKPTKSKPLPKH